MDPKRKLQQHTEQGTEQELSLQKGQTVREFGSVEELLRHDAAQTVVPPAIAAQLRESIAQEPSARTGWWRRLFG
jgi:hypothetical protein